MVLCSGEFDLAATEGVLGLQLYSCLAALAVSLGGDIQNLEGLNSQIKFIGNKCNFVSLALLSGRIGIKYQYNMCKQFSEAGLLACRMRWGRMGIPET